MKRYIFADYQLVQRHWVHYNRNGHSTLPPAVVNEMKRLASDAHPVSRVLRAHGLGERG